MALWPRRGVGLPGHVDPHKERLPVVGRLATTAEFRRQTSKYKIPITFGFAHFKPGPIQLHRTKYYKVQYI